MVSAHTFMDFFQHILRLGFGKAFQQGFGVSPFVEYFSEEAKPGCSILNLPSNSLVVTSHIAWE
jgi:hypothetical protein